MAELSDTEREQIVKRLARPSGLVEGVCSISGEPVVLDRWQARLVDTEDRFTITNKARQTGNSFCYGSRAWSRCYLSAPRSYTAIFCSVNLDDAREKMRYVNLLDAEIPNNMRMKRVLDNKMEIEFVNGNRILCSFHPRGKGKADVMLDELAHIQDGRSLYQACLPIISRGGSIHIGSTPLAKAGIFHDIYVGADGKFSNFKRYNVPWWTSSALCADVSGGKKDGVGKMPTAERVRKYGTPILQDIYDNMFEEDFQTEYECEWSDESRAFLPWSLIEMCSPTGDNVIFKCDDIEGLRFLHGDLYVGMDVGRRINASEIFVCEYMSKLERFELRLLLTLDGTAAEFNEQERVINKILSFSNVKTFVIDENGLGMMLAERATEKWGSRVVAQKVSPTTKPEIANNMRMMMERGQFFFYPDRETRQQFHSVKKVVTSHSNVIYDVDKNEKHHADKFWAAALMLFGASERVIGLKPEIHILRGREDDDFIHERVGLFG